MYTEQERIDARWIAMLSPPDRNRGGVSSYAKQGSGYMHVNDQGTIDSRLDARISIITLNRPAKLNALTSKMIFAFCAVRSGDSRRIDQGRGKGILRRGRYR
jgi:hypothetical protein